MSLFNLIAQNNITIPGFGNVSGLKQLRPEFTNLGSFLSQSLNLAFMIAVFLAFFWLVWGAFQYIFAGGDKQSLAKARSRLTWAIVGLLLLAISFAIAQWAEQIFLQPTKNPFLGQVTTVYAADPVVRPNAQIGDFYQFGWIQSLGQGTNLLVVPTFSIATTAVAFYFIIGALKYLLSAGNKESVAAARAMITHAIIGFLILMLIFIVLQFIPEFFGINFRIFTNG